MKSLTLTLVLVAAFAVVALAEPEPEPAKAARYRSAQIIDDDSQLAIDDSADDNKSDVDAKDTNKQGDASSGRLFMKKFLLFKNMFGQNQQQPIIPIIITGGGGTGTTTGGTTPPTTTITSTGSIPSGSGTITTSPATGNGNTGNGNTGNGANGGANGANGRIQLLARAPYDTRAQETEEEDEAENEQMLAAALAAGAEEYVVTDQEIKGTSDAKANRGPAHINLRRRGAKNGQVVSVRIPPKYRGYFKPGQRVVLNNANRPSKRRVVKKRVVRNRRKNKNKRRRVVG